MTYHFERRKDEDFQREFVDQIPEARKHLYFGLVAAKHLCKNVGDNQYITTRERVINECIDEIFDFIVEGKKEG